MMYHDHHDSDVMVLAVSVTIIMVLGRGYVNHDDVNHDRGDI
jgi:hypothetical protein